MFKIYVISVAAAFLSIACGSSAPNANTSANIPASVTTNANVIKLDPANMPPGLSGSPLPVNNVPGIPSNGAVVLPKGTTPTPGIPGPDQIRKGVKPGLTPTPGIPDPATIRKQMGLPPLNINAVPPGGSTPLPKGKKSTGGRPG